MRASNSLQKRSFTCRLGAVQPLHIALLLFLFGLAIHLPFAIFDAFGEQDAARLALKAFHGMMNGELEVGGQWPYSYPLYIHLLYLLMKHGVVATSSVPAVMAFLSLIAGALYTTMLFLYVHRLTDNKRAALVAALFLQTVPIFWMSSLYGFPTILALSLLMTAAWGISWALLGRSLSTVARGVTIIIAFGVFLLSVFIKVDAVTAAAVFCMPLWKGPASHRKRLVGCMAVLAAAAVAFFLINRYGAALSPEKTATDSWQRWSKSFFGGAAHLFAGKHLAIIHHAAGAMTPLLAAVGAIIAVAKTSYRQVALLTLAAALPSALFWSIIEGNSARHNLIMAALLPILVVLPLTLENIRFSRYWLGGICFVVLLNYVWYPPSSGTVKPSGRLVESAMLLGERTREARRTGRRIADMTDPNIIVIAPNHTFPYYYYEILTADRLTLEHHARELLIMRNDRDQKQVYRFPFKGKLRAMRSFQEQGYKTVWLYNKALEKLSMQPGTGSL